MRSRVIPGSSPTIDRRLPVSRLNSVDLPTLGRPTMATSGSLAAPALTGTTDLRYVGKAFLPQRDRLRFAVPPVVYCQLDLAALRSVLTPPLAPLHPGFSIIKAAPSMPSSDASTRALPSLHEFFAPGGILSSSPLPYEYRSGQLRNGQSRRARTRRAPAPHRRSRHGHRQNARLSSPRAPHRPARHRLHRYQGPPGPALLSRHPLPRDPPRPAPRLLHEGPRQLPLPPQALRPSRSAHSVGT